MSISQLSNEVSDMQSDVASMKGTIDGHEIRLDNGSKAISQNSKDIAHLQPKAPDWLKILLAGLTIILVLMGGQLWITSEFAKRAKNEDVDKKIAPLQKAQKETAQEIKDIEKAQSAQQVSVSNIEKAQADQGKKIDLILQRLPARRNNR